MSPLDQIETAKSSTPGATGNVLNMRPGGLPTGHDLLVRKRRHRLAVDEARAMLVRARHWQHGLIHNHGVSGNAARAVNRADLASAVQQLETATVAARAKLDSLTEMGDLEALRLKLAMHRMAQMMTRLSGSMETAMRAGAA